MQLDFQIGVNGLVVPQTWVHMVGLSGNAYSGSVQSVGRDVRAREGGTSANRLYMEVRARGELRLNFLMDQHLSDVATLYVLVQGLTGSGEYMPVCEYMWDRYGNPTGNIQSAGVGAMCGLDVVPVNNWGVHETQVNLKLLPHPECVGTQYVQHRHPLYDYRVLLSVQ